MKPNTPCYVELESMNDLARLVCALERTPMLVFSLRLHDEKVLASRIDFLMGRPITYYAECEKSGEFLAYRNLGGFEEIAIVDAITNPTLSYAPIIRVDKLPSKLMKNVKVEKDGCISIKLNDVASLAKIGSYRMFYEEPPLPLFLFKDGKPVLGTFMSIDDSDNGSYFYYTELDSVPSETFMRYSGLRAEKPAFTNKIDEHGYIYMKIIRLHKHHPLVMFND